jgi:hypothetical protein
LPNNRNVKKNKEPFSSNLLADHKDGNDGFFPACGTRFLELADIALGRTQPEKEHKTKLIIPVEGKPLTPQPFGGPRIDLIKRKPGKLRRGESR